MWWRYGDLNPRHFACEANTLPLSYTPTTTLKVMCLRRSSTTISHYYHTFVALSGIITYLVPGIIFLRGPLVIKTHHMDKKLSSPVFLLIVFGIYCSAIHIGMYRYARSVCHPTINALFISFFFSLSC